MHIIAQIGNSCFRWTWPYQRALGQRSPTVNLVVIWPIQFLADASPKWCIHLMVIFESIDSSPSPGRDSAGELLPGGGCSHQQGADCHRKPWGKTATPQRAMHLGFFQHISFCSLFIRNYTPKFILIISGLSIRIIARIMVLLIVLHNLSWKNPILKPKPILRPSLEISIWCLSLPTMCLRYTSDIVILTFKIV